MGSLFLDIHDCSHKFIDGDKTMIRLMFKDLYTPVPISIGYCATEESIDEVKANTEKYIDIILMCIKENIVVESE